MAQVASRARSVLGRAPAAAPNRIFSFVGRTKSAFGSFRHMANPVWPPKAHPGGVEAGFLSIKPDMYPDVKREDCVEELHGVSVSDPYRWLEDADSAETKSYAVLANCGGRDELKEILKKLMDYPKQGVPYKRGGLQNQSVMYSCKQPGEEGEVFYDPNTLSSDGTTALTSAAFSKDGKLLAINLSEKGSDWKSTHVLEVPAEGPPTNLSDHLKYVKFSSPSWTVDNKGFFYCGYDKPATDDLGTETDVSMNHKIMYHRIGTAQESDVFCFATPDHPTWILGAQATSGGRWLWITASDGCVPANQAWVVDLDEVPRAADGSLDFTPSGDSGDSAQGALFGRMKHLANNWESQWGLVAAEGPLLTLLTNDRSPRNRIVALDASTAAEGALSSGSFTEVLAQHPNDLLQDATALKGDMMVVQWMRDVADIAELRRLSDGALLATLAEGMPGTMSGVCTEPQRASTEFWFSKQTFVEPPAIFRIDGKSALADTPPADVPTLTPELFHRTPMKVAHNPDDYVVTQVFVNSKDGTKVPMFVGHRKGATLGPSTPALLYGYGGFNISLQPTFSATWLTWMKAFDGVFALANLRGGGEYGREWRDAGSLMKKQNVFDDMHACAEYLCSEKYTSPARLTINGGSNGGLLVCACSNQRPDLYGCVLSQVPVTDMLRFHKFTIGHAWCTDFGNPDDAELFKYLLKYSPYHTVQKPSTGQFPATMLTTASHDDRVVPLHSFKQIAEMQYKIVKAEGSTQTNPIIARIDTNAGHGAGKPTSKRIEEGADMLAFAAAVCGAKIKTQ